MLFRLERTIYRLTQRKLANKSGVNQVTVNSIENAQESWRILTLKKVANDLGKALQDLLPLDV